jgi:hypothetical protein
MALGSEFHGAGDGHRQCVDLIDEINPRHPAPVRALLSPCVPIAGPFRVYQSHFPPAEDGFHCQRRIMRELYDQGLEQWAIALRPSPERHGVDVRFLTTIG